MKKNRIKLGVVIFALVATAAFFVRNNIDNPLPVAEGQANNELIFISSIRGYQSNGLIPIASTDEPAVNISSYNNQSGSGTAQLYESNLDNLQNFLLHDDKDNQLNKNVDVSNLRLVQSINVNLSSNAITKVTLPLAESGIWYLSFSKDNQNAGAYIIRSKLGTVLKQGGNDFILWTQNFSTGRKVTAGSVKLMNLQNQATILDERSIDDQGIVTFPVNERSDIALVQAENEITVVPINLYYLNSNYDYTRFQNRVLSSRYFMFTDRPIYRPGDTVYFKAIIRDDDDANYSVPRGQATLKITREWDSQNPVFERNFAVSVDGTISGSYVLPETTGTGQYQALISIPGRQNNNEFWGWGAYGDYVYFTVEHFRKPEYSIDITSNLNEYVAKETIQAKVSGQYFFGQPLANSTVKYKVSRAHFWDYDYYYSYMEDYYLNDDYMYGVRYGTEIKSGEIKLNEKGEALIEVVADWDGDKNQIVSIEAEFVDDSGNPSFARKNFLVYAADFGLYREEGSYSGRVGNPFQLPLILKSNKDENTEISNVAISVQPVRTQWIPYQNPNNKYGYSYRQENEVFPEQIVRTDSSGRAKFNFSPEKPGSYTFHVRSQDLKGNDLAKTFYAWISDRNDVFYGDDKATLTLRADKQRYLPGNDAEITVTSAMPNRDVFVTVERAKVLRHQVVSLNGNTAKFRLPLNTGDKPNVFVTASSFTNSDLNSGQTNITVSADDQKIFMELISDKKTLAPGETVNLTVKTTTIRGLPVATDAAVWAVDKALFELVENPLGDIHNAFWQERYNQTRTTTSLEGIGRRTAEGGGCFAAGTKVLMADGTKKKIEEVKVGDEVLTFTSEKDYTLVSAKVTKIHEAEEAGYLIINSNLKVTSNHIMFIDGKWQQAGNVQPGSLLMNDQGQSVAVSSIEWQKGKTQVYNLTVDKQHTFFADDVWVHNDKGGGLGATRSVFKDTAYWNPSVRTNSLGLATVSFKLPDNLTTWAVAGVAATADTQVGQGTTEVLVTKDLIVRPILPNILREGDDITLSALIHNYTGSSQDIRVQFDFDAGEILSNKEETILVNDRDFTQLSWTVKPNRVTEKAKLTFSASSSSNPNLSDRIIQEIPVKPFGYVQKQGSTGENDKTYDIELKKDTNVEQSKVTLSLSPTLLGTLPTSMKYLINYPYGCVEQTTSRFVPAVIAKANASIFGNALEGKDVDDMIKVGLVRLSSMQNDNGGWSWWYSGGSDPFITAYVVDYVVRARNTGAEVDNQMLVRARQFLESTYDARIKQNYTQADNVAKIYGLSLLGSANGRTLITNFDGLTPDLVSLAIMANIRNGNRNIQTNGVSHLLSMAKTQGDGMFWDGGTKERFGSTDASTGLALRALAAANQRDSAIKAVRYLMTQKRVDYWSNSFATAQVIQGVADHTLANREITSSFSYTVSISGKQIASGTVAAGQQAINDVVVPTSELNGKKQLQIIKTGGGTLYSTLVVHELRTDKDSSEVNNGFTIRRDYENAKGPEYSIGVGDLVNVRLKVTLNGEANYAVIADELPSGLIPINESLRNQQYDPYYLGTPYDYYYRYYNNFGVTDKEVTQNGMVLSLYRIGSGEHTYTYRARAVSAGEFAIPPATAELMYSPEVNGTSIVQSLTIDGQSAFKPVNAIRAKFGIFKSDFWFIIIGFLVSVAIGTLLYRKGWIKSPFTKKTTDSNDQSKNDSNNGSANPPGSTSG